MRVIHLPAIDKVVPLGAYLHAIRIAKANPEKVFSAGLTAWSPATGAEIMDQFRRGMMQWFNEAVPYVRRSLPKGGAA
jgi:hypothetical protein